ncbi:fas-binding factor 1 homolog [Plakobranchus ocellatus]|uniref:Fas-binding factor 1 homolog n=1 Tax=Plakobranchus ocellatus TaxID=259542 RepID=A0AAV3YY38_9GAST|nr:fas-binding factor 1 homolog [Plakobranchus ocellatus]
MDFSSGGKKVSKKENESLDDLLGDLLSSNATVKRRPEQLSPTRQRSKGAKQSGKDDNFYSSLAAMADSDGASDISEADVSKVAHSIGGLDDMDADLFGGSLSKSQSSGNRANGKPTTPRRNTPPSKGNKSPTRGHSPSRSETPTSPPGSARGSLKRKPVKPPSPSTIPTNSSPAPLSQTPTEPKPLTAPGKMSDLSSASESLIPGQKPTQRPDTAPKIKKKYDFGDFDPDDPLAGVLSDEDDDLSDSDRPKSATKKPASAFPAATVTAQSKKTEETKADSPRRRNLMERPPTRSGSNDGDKKPGVLAASGTAKSEKPPPQPSGLFSDSDGDMLDGLGLDAGAQAKKVEAKPKPDAEALTPARSVFDSLLGKSSSTAAQLLEPKGKKQFVLDSKYSSSVAGSGEAKEEEDDFNFGSYQPSAASGSRPNSRRSVRFQDDDDIFGLDTQPSPRTKSPGGAVSTIGPTPQGMEWLESATVESVKTPSSANSVAPASPAITSTPKESAPKHTSSTAGTVPAKPPTPQKKAGGDSGTVVSTPQRQTVTNTAPSPRAWLGLGSDSDDDDLFKPKKSSARSAALPQSPATSASPRVVHKKQSKKDASSPKPSPAAATKEDSDDDAEEDDWLARARSRRQQMLAKDSARSAGSMDGPTPTASARSAAPDTNVGVDTHDDGQSIKVDLSSLIMDSPKFGGSARNEMSNDIFSRPQSQRQGQGIPNWESPRTALSRTINESLASNQTPGTPTTQPNSAQSHDARLKFAASAFGQEQPPTPQSQQLRQQQQQQQQQQQYPPRFEAQQEGQTKLKLEEQAQQLQQMLHTVQAQQRAAAVSSIPSSSIVVPPSYMQMSPLIELPDSLAEAHAKIRKLELEKGYTESLLESVRRRYEEEMIAVENSYKNRLLVVEDSNRKKEARLLEENEHLMQQHLGRLRQLEQEKSSLSSSLYSKLEDFEMEKAKDIEKVKDQHRLAVQTLKREHEEALERLARAKNQEIEMVANANDTSKSLTAVVEQVQNNARDLGELHMKVEGWNRQGLDEREISLRSKDEQLRMLQERLSRQEEDNSRERKRLEDLITRMETQLRDQTKSLEEERWKLKQDQARAEAQQRGLEEERRMWLDQQARERLNMERARENFLEEQRSASSQVSEERRAFAEERSKFQVEQRVAREKIQQDALKRGQAEADYEILTRTIQEEKSQHAQRMQELRKEEERMEREHVKWERERAQLEREREELAQQARQIRQQSEQIDQVTETARRTQLEGEQAMEEAMQYNAQIEKREADLQRQGNGLKLMEEHIAQEKLRLAKEKKELENLKSASLCTNCRSPLHGGSVGLLSQPQNGYFTPQQSMTRVQINGFSMSAHQPGTNPLDQIAASIASDRALRLFKIQAMKDKEYLEEESMYLESLKHMPYHPAVSKS